MTSKQRTALQRKVCNALQQHSYLSYRTIASICGCSESYVQKIASDNYFERSNAITLTDSELTAIDDLWSERDLNPETEAADCNTDPQRLDELSYSDDADVRGLVPNNPQTMQSTIDRLAFDTDPWVRYCAFLHASIGLFDRMMKEPESYVKARLSDRSDLTSAMMQQLLHDPELEVQASAARRVQDPEWAQVEHLLAEQSTAAALLSNYTLNKALVLQIFENGDEDITILAVSHPNFDFSEIPHAAHHSSSRVRSALAYRDDIPDDIYAQFVFDPSFQVVCALVSNPNTPDEHIGSALSRTSTLSIAAKRELIELACENPNIAISRLRAIFESIKDQAKSMWIDNSAGVLESIASNSSRDPELPGLLHDVLLSSQGVESVERALANNPSTGLLSLLVLTKSRYDDVVDAAQWQLEYRTDEFNKRITGA